MTSRMARRRLGRPPNPERSKVIPITVSESMHALIGTIASVENVARATWAQRELLKAVARHGRRAARL